MARRTIAVIASRRRSNPERRPRPGLLRRYAPRNDGPPVIASEAKQSRTAVSTWIASSPTLLAMTDGAGVRTDEAAGRVHCGKRAPRNALHGRHLDPATACLRASRGDYSGLHEALWMQDAGLV